MRISLLAAGSLGDLLPYLALARGLERAGHRVRFATLPAYEADVAGAGSEFFSLGGADPKAVWTDLAARRPTRNPLRLARHLFGPKPGFAEGLRRQAAACEGADLVIVTSATVHAAHAAVGRGQPAVWAQVTPVAATAAFPRPIGPFRLQRARLGGWYNRLTHEATELMFWQADHREVEEWRIGELGLPRLRWPRGVAWGRRLPTLFGFSPSVVPRPSDWPRRHHVTGYWFGEPPMYQPTAELAAFLTVPGPMAFVGFGSHVVDPRLCRDVFLPGLRKAGFRVVLGGGWSQFEGVGQAEGVHLIQRVPYSWIFPRVDLVLHHCGAGTAAEAMRAGARQLCLPFSGEQRFWGERLHDAGVAPPPLDPRTLTAGRLAYVVGRAVRNRYYARRAAEVAQAIGREDGVAVAIRWIEHYASQGPASYL